MNNSFNKNYLGNKTIKNIIDYVDDENILLFFKKAFVLNFKGSKIKYFCMLLTLPVYLLLLIGNNPETKPKQYHLGVRCYRNDFGVHQNKLRGIDFLLDGKKLNKDNTLFCIEGNIDPGYIQSLKNKKYRYVKLKDIFKQGNKKIIDKKYIKTCILVGVRSIFEDKHVGCCCFHILYNMMLWKCFCSLYKIKHYVVYNNYEPEHIIRNIVLNQHNTKTYLYIHSVHNWNVFEPVDSPIGYREIVFSFAYYDFLISWNEKTGEYITDHCSNIGQVVALGCLYSEHVRMIQEGYKL